MGFWDNGEVLLEWEEKHVRERVLQECGVILGAYGIDPGMG